MLFQDYMDALAKQMREAEALSNTRYALNTPYFIGDELQYIVHEALLQVLKEIPNADFEGFSSLAVLTIAASGGASPYTGIKQIALPLNTVRILGVSVDGKPSVPATTAPFVQALNMTGTRWTNRWTPMMGKIMFFGTAAVITALVEPTLTDWKAATAPVLPVGYDTRAVSLMLKRVIIADYGRT